MITTYPKPWPGYTVPEFGGPLNGLLDVLTNPAGWVVKLFDKPQSWYSKVERIQNAYVVLSAEVNAFGRGIWDTIQRSIAAEIAEGRGAGLPARFPGFDWLVEDIGNHVKTILITKSHTPTDQEIAVADGRLPIYREAVDYAKYVAPEVAYQVEADAAKAKDAVSRAPLRSPAEVGVQTFIEDLEKRLKLFGMFGLGTIAIVAVAAAIGLAIYASMMRGGRR